MLNIEHAKPTVKRLLSHLDSFESHCIGEIHFTPSEFRQINKELSIGAVLMMGKHRYQTNAEGKRLFWIGLDNREHDMGLTHDTNIMRDYPGFNAKRSRSLGGNFIKDNKVITTPNGRGNISIVTMEDGSTGIGPNYRVALRNAAMKMHLKSKFNFMNLSNVWARIWGHA